ncbi:MAG: hypothetical protein ACK4TC_04900 [Sphingomonas pseudosanguinis]|uniref:hypothetical protein n=1 Tax=Sphingomonas pseudosanguinis TaxID=413712 RepID=UPI00391A2306
MSDKIKAFIVRDFTDAGEERNFTASEAGKPETMPDIDAKTFANYAAAGLVREPKDEEVAPAATTKAGKAA